MRVYVLAANEYCAKGFELGSRMSDLRNLPLTGLRALAAAARHRSLSRAADELAVTPGAIGHQVRQLERRLGLTLLRRSGNQLVLSDTAQRALGSLETGFAELSAAVDILTAESTRRSLTLAADPSFAALWIAPRLHAVRAAIHPRDVRIVAPVPLDRLEAEGVDVAISYRSVAHAGLEAVRLLNERVIPACAPSLAGDGGAEVLERLPLLHIDRSMGDDVYPTWQTWFAVAGLGRADLSRGPHFGLTVMAAQAAVAGNGAVLASEVLLQPHIAAGQLTHLAPDGPELGLERHLVWPKHGRHARSTASLAEALAEPAN